MKTSSKIIVSNQAGIHENLASIVRKHLESEYRKPVADHTKRAFAAVCARLEDVPARPIILDACCGVGDSSRALAAQFPDHWVVGIDKSESRIMRERPTLFRDNLILMRADLVDFYRLAVEAGWTLTRHYVLYPNPYPKSVHIKRRWHGSPVFPYMLKLGGAFEMRSNWCLYLEEFAAALEIAGHSSRLESFEADEPLTAFERKYSESGQPLYRLSADLG